jgi:tetratricopeptide (TPR) repeat protein
MYAQLLLILQRNDEAEAQIELSVSIDPFNDGTKLLYSGTLAQAGDSEAALTVAEEVVAIIPTSMNANYMIEHAAYHLREYDKVISAVQYTLPFSLEKDVYEGIVRMYNESGIAAAYSELMKHMEEFAENNPMGFLDMSSRYIVANQPEKALDWIEKGFELRDWQISYIVASGRLFEPLYDNPRFIAICEKANLPLPTTH